MKIEKADRTQNWWLTGTLNGRNVAITIRESINTSGNSSYEIVMCEGLKTGEEIQLTEEEEKEVLGLITGERKLFLLYNEDVDKYILHLAGSEEEIRTTFTDNNWVIKELNPAIPANSWNLNIEANVEIDIN